MGLFLARDFHPKSGMKYLIQQFYRSILENGSPPIPYREILLTARIMDCIFRQLAVTSPETSSNIESGSVQPLTMRPVGSGVPLQK
jgi:hypothetical protein